VSTAEAPEKLDQTEGYTLELIPNNV